MTNGPAFSFAIYSTSAHRHRRCGVGCCGCCRGKITCACRHRRCGVGSSRWNINHAAVRPRVLSVGTTSPVIARTSNPLILDVPVSSGVFCVAQTNNTKIIRQNKNSNHFLLTTFQCGFLCSCRPSPVLSAHPVLRARAYSDWSPLTVPRTRARTVVFLQIGNCTSYHRTVRASRCTTSAARIVRCRSGANSVVCPVSLRPEMTSHVRRFHITPPVSSHPRRACNSAYSSRVAGDVGSRSVHAAAFDATYQSPPTIVGSVLGAGQLHLVWMAILLHSRRCGAMSCV